MGNGQRGGYRLYSEQDLQRLRFIRYKAAWVYTNHRRITVDSRRSRTSYLQGIKAIVDSRLHDVESGDN